MTADLYERPQPSCSPLEECFRGVPGVRLAAFDNAGFSRGRSRLTEALWIAVQWLLVSSWIPGSAHRRWLLRLFGARLGAGVVLKPGVRVKFPWRLTIGDHAWVGEGVWIDNLAPVSIGANCCLSQEAYLCTGSHDWSNQRFGLIARPISIGDCAWIAARAILAPGTTVGEGAVLSLGSVGTHRLDPWTIYCGHPAKAVKIRKLT